MTHRLLLLLSSLLCVCFWAGSGQSADWEFQPNTLDSAADIELRTLAAALTQEQTTVDSATLSATLARFAALLIQHDNTLMAEETTGETTEEMAGETAEKTAEETTGDATGKTVRATAEETVGKKPARLSVSEFGRQTLASLPPNMLTAWRQIADEGVRTQSQHLKTTPHSATDALRELKRIQRVYPNSSYESQLSEQIAKLQTKLETAFPSANAASCTYRCSAVQILAEDGQVVFEDFLPQDAWGTLYPSREWKAEYTEVFFPQRLVQSVDGEVVVARMGTTVTIWPAGQRDLRPQAYLAALEPKADGRLRWLIQPDSPQWVFAGEPLLLDELVCIPMLQLSEPPRLYAVAYDLKEGTLRWRTLLGTLWISNEPYQTVEVPQGATVPHVLNLGDETLGFQMQLDVLDGHWLSTKQQPKEH